MTDKATSERREDGGKAFPFPSCSQNQETGETVVTQGEPGLSVRDYFAGAAMQGMLAHSTRYRPAEGYPSDWHAAISREAYELADAMLRARAATGE